MTWSSIRFKTYAALVFIALSAIIAGGTMVHMIDLVKEDTDVVVALDRQRMLTQTMAKAAMGYVLAKSGSQSLEQQVRILDAYMAQIELSLVNPGFPEAVKSEAVGGPRQACPVETIVRTANKAFATQMDVAVTLLGQHPINPDNRLRDATDHLAIDWLQSHSGEIFSTALKNSDGLKLRFYTALPIQDDHCKVCHKGGESMTSTTGKVTAIRRYVFHFSGDIALGKAELEPSLIEYYLSRDLFKATLAALRFGGNLPLDRMSRSTKTIDPLDVPAVKTRLDAMDVLFKQFTESAQELFKAPLGSEVYRQARQAINEQSNRLRSISEDLVQIHTGLLLREQEKRILTVATVVLVIVLVVIFVVALSLRRYLLTPLENLRDAMKAMASGNLYARAHIDRKNDEIGHMGQAFNRMADHLAMTIRDLRLHASSLTALTQELVGLEKVMDKNIRTGSALNRQAEGWMQQMEHSMPTLPQAAPTDTDNFPNGTEDWRIHANRLAATMAETGKLAAINYGVLDHARLLTEMITEVSQSLQRTEQEKPANLSTFDITTLKQQYLHWFGEIIRVIQNPQGNHPVPETLQNPQTLPPNRWLLAQGQTRIGHRGHFKGLLAAHNDFHQAAAAILELPRPMDHNETLQCMARLNQICKTIFLFLDQLYTDADP